MLSYFYICILSSHTQLKKEYTEYKLNFVQYVWHWITLKTGFIFNNPRLHRSMQTVSREAVLER